MKSIYLDNNIHNKLKLLATLHHRSLTSLVEELISKGIENEIEDLSQEALQKLAAMGGGFDFLENPEEDIYSSEDGELIEE
ncbi:MAG: hypothetical protein HY538_04795 [Deltaproteobacteria bacterium]|nr:hypothetical protein [Deltaproteobacteria bacterium]